MGFVTRWGDGETWGWGRWGRWGDLEMGRWGDEETRGKGNSGGVLKSVRVLELFFCIEVLYSYYGGGVPFFVEGFGFSSFFVGETYEHVGNPKIFGLEFVYLKF